MGTPRPFLIGGEWRSHASSDSVRNPFSGDVVAEVCQAGEEEADQAVKAAEAGFRAMRRLSSHGRSTALLTIARGIAARQEELAQTVTAEAGKPISDSRREVSRAVHTFAIAAEEAKRISGEVIPLDVIPGAESYLGLSQRFPVGPILGITPFNFPLNLVAHKVAPALAAGNSIVLKPAPQTPLTALMLGEIISEVGLPPGALNVLPCSNRVAETLVTDPRFKVLSFTGSAPVGWMLKAKAGNKRVLLELGGNAGVIVESDADLDLAAQRCATGGFGYSGQTCISVQRIFVQESVHERFLQTLLTLVRGMKAGDPSDDHTVIGPLIDQTAAARIEGWIGEAVAQGGRLLLGGKRSGSLLEATVMSEVRSDMKVCSEEVFGPLVTVTPYRRFEEALEAMNQSSFGLQAGVFTRDINRVFRAYRDLEVGAVLANEIPTFRIDSMPYGGVKDSGLGREGVRYAIDEMTEVKLLVLNLRDASEQ